MKTNQKKRTPSDSFKMDLRGIVTVHGFRVQRFRVQRSEVRGHRSEVHGSEFNPN
jgi:hypothetical protein